MRGGEGAPRDTSVEVTSPDPPLDGADDASLLSPVSSSRYSSCGESEFDKYCSANSVMGTPSLCGSAATFHDFHESEFSSFRSFRLGDENAFDLLRSDFKLDDRRCLSLGADAHNQKDVSFDAQGGLGKRNSAELRRMEKNGLSSLELEGVSDVNIETFGSDEGGISVPGDWNSLMHCSSANESTIGRGNGEAIKDHVSKMEVDKYYISHSRLSIEQVNRGFEGLNLHSGLGFEGTDGERCSDEGETSSRFEHSEGEDSMYGCGTDDEKEIGLSHRGYGHYSQEATSKHENPLLMTSTIAFGSDDWNDFMQETKESPFTPLQPNDLQGQKQQRTETERDSLKSISATTSEFHGLDVAEKHDVRVNQAQEGHAVAASSKTHSGDPMSASEFAEEDQVEIMKGMIVTTSKVESNLLNAEEGLEIEGIPLTDGVNIMDSGLGWRHQYRSKLTDMRGAHFTGSEDCEETHSPVDPLFGSTANHVSSTSEEAAENRKGQLFEDRQSHSVQASAETNMKTTLRPLLTSLSITVDHPRQIKMESLELNSFYNEIVNDMEEILMDSRESPGARFTQGKTMHPFQVPSPLRDGGSTASTSSMLDSTPLGRHPLKIDRVEVIGARQKKGDVSLGERLVGVKEYTVYKMRVWSGDDCWEVERRYRDFFTLYRRLKTSFSNQGWILPSPWSSVGPESRKFFGNASPGVVAERSVLIQECLQSLLHSRFSLSQLSSLIWFLSPSDGVNSPISDRDVPQSPNSTGGTNTSAYTLGQSISLIVEIRPSKNMRQMLEAQHYSCAGCHKHFDDGKTRMWELVQTLGWGKPRFCMYSGQLFCLSCHTNETAVLPARVLHLWDFTEYPVSQLAKSYLDSIHDQPMLCVSAVNPFLFSKVPALQHVTNVRKRIGGMLPYVRCPFRRSVYKGLGSRRYVLEGNDFFALRDLIDLSKGVFAALPVMVETVSRKITEHITDQCLICYDVGVPCSARQACDDPSSLIFPFQEGEVEKCKSCGLVFHRPCFKRTSSCPCGVLLGPTVKGRIPSVGNEVVASLDFLGKTTESKSSVGFLSELFSKVMPEKLWQRGDNDNVILMGSLPSTSL